MIEFARSDFALAPKAAVSDTNPGTYVCLASLFLPPDDLRAVRSEPHKLSEDSVSKGESVPSVEPLFGAPRAALFHVKRPSPTQRRSLATFARNRCPLEYV